MAWYCNIPWIMAQAAAAPAADDGLSVTLKLIIAVAAIVGSFFAGSLIARGLRMPDFAGRIGLVLFTLVLSLVVIVLGWPPKRGIDLSGGVVLVYEVDQSLSQPSWMETAVSRLNELLNAEGGEKLDAKPVSADHIEVDLPEGVAPARVEKAVADLRKNADFVLQSDGRRREGDKTVLVYRVDTRQQQTIDMPKLIAAVSRRINPSGVKELTIRQYGAEQLEVIIPEVEEREVDQIKKLISTSGVLEFRIVANETDDKDIIKAALKTPGRDVYIGGHLAGRWVLAGPDISKASMPFATMRQTEGRGPEILVRIDPYNVDGRYLKRASQDFAEGNPAVHFSFDATGGAKFGQLTSHNLPDEATGLYRHLGIVLDNTMLSAPRINSTINGEGQITGRFTQEEVDSLIGVLNAGSLPATLRPEPISQQRISSQLGDDTIRRGSLAMIISTVAILVFMGVYYRFAGMVADIAVTLNMVATVALMILVKAAFTLPGLAGMVLTVGMAVDANVLIYERMREELERGASLRMAIRNGFSRALATIIDSHVTTLASAVVLFVVGTDQIRGFAVTLILGLLMSLFTAVFVARVLFDIAERKRWLTKLRMMHLIGHTNIDFIRWLVPAISVSVLIVAVGLVAAAVRGPELLDIDFTGGSSVQLLFASDKPHNISEVRQVVSELSEELPDVAVSRVGENDLEFKIDTSNGDIKLVQAALEKAFRGSLETYNMSFGPLSEIKPTPPKDTEAKDTEAKDTEAKDQASPSPPAEQPAATSAPEESTPPEEKPAGEKPAAETPPEEKPADSTPKADEPAPPKSAARNGRVRAIQLASVGREAAIAAFLIGQDEPAPAASAQPAEPAPAAAAPEKSAAEEPPAAAPTAEAESASTPPAASPSDTAPAAAAPSAATSPAVESPSENAEAARSLVGGTHVMLTFPQSISFSSLHDMVQQELQNLKLQDVRVELSNPKYQAGSDARYNDWTLEVSLPPDQAGALLKNIQDYVQGSPVFPSSSEIGGKVAGDTQMMALYALLASMVMIVVYIWIRFQNVVFGLAAVLALVHDVLVTIAFLALSSYLSPYLGFLLVDPFKISLAVLAALLTIVGFSINDTIVVFDRIREVRGKSPELTSDIINRSINQTLSRTLLTSGTVFIASIILYIVGGPGIHAFAFAMSIGVIAGTYSSIYMAPPVLLWMRRPSARTTKPAGGIASVTAGKK